MSNLKPVDELRNTLKLMEPQFKMALPNHIPVDKFIRVAQTAIQSNPALLTADRTSLFASCMKAAQEGLLPDNKEAALVMFKDKVQYMPMIAGILKKVRNSGELASITSQLVYENDDFRYWIDSDGEHLNHEPNMFGDRGEIKGVYAIAKTKDGAVYIEVMTAAQVEDVKKSSRSAQYGPWSGLFALEMWRKTALRRLSKRLPMSTDIESAIKADDYMYDVEEKAVEEIKDIPKEKSSKRLKAIVKSNNETKAIEAKDIEVTDESQTETKETI